MKYFILFLIPTFALAQKPRTVGNRALNQDYVIDNNGGDTKIEENADNSTPTMVIREGTNTGGNPRLELKRGAHGATLFKVCWLCSSQKEECKNQRSDVAEKAACVEVSLGCSNHGYSHRNKAYQYRQFKTTQIGNCERRKHA